MLHSRMSTTLRCTMQPSCASGPMSRSTGQISASVRTLAGPGADIVNRGWMPLPPPPCMRLASLFRLAMRPPASLLNVGWISAPLCMPRASLSRWVAPPLIKQGWLLPPLPCIPQDVRGRSERKGKEKGPLAWTESSGALLGSTHLRQVPVLEPRSFTTPTLRCLRLHRSCSSVGGHSLRHFAMRSGFMVGCGPPQRTIIE
mmetsp:Transcript_105296/g.235073  ORF Transcript_105296/g.235073 Transcript_105296/m.235073 type:complete len:201 (-) Transcript_105296:559-1161(-)